MANFSSEDLAQIQAIREFLPRVKRLFVITGAGLSADSNLPTYRGIGGLYNDCHTEDHIPIERALSLDYFHKDPTICWKYLARIEKACRGATFNQGHQVLRQMEKHFAHMCVLTQNVDGFHHKAGSKNVIDIHGNIHHLRCPKCAWRENVPDFSHLDMPPACPQCGRIIRPDVVLFGEMLPPKKVKQLEDELAQGFDLIFTIGTSSMFPYVTQPLYLSRALGIPAVEINPSHTEVSHIVDHKIKAGAAESLQAIWENLF